MRHRRPGGARRSRRRSRAAARDVRRAAPPRARRRGHLERRPGQRSPTAGCRSSTSRMATSRWPAATAASSSSRTARSTTTRRCARELAARAGTGSPPAATPRCSSTATRSAGDASLERLRGMFAIAIWDAAERRLLLARDRFGIKPLYWTRPGRRARRSPPSCKAPARRPASASEIDPEALEAYLAFNSIPAPLTIFRGVAQARARPPARVASRAPRPTSAAGAGRPRSRPPTSAARRSTRSRRSCASGCATPSARTSSPTCRSASCSRAASTPRARRARRAGVARARVDVLDRLRGAVVRRARAGARRSRDALRHRPPRARRRRAPTRRRAAAEDRRRLRRAVRRLVGAADLPGLAACRRARQGRALGRGRRRAVRRLRTYVADLLAPRLGRAAQLARPLVARLPSSSRRVSLDYMARRFTRAAHLPPLEAHHGWKEILAPDLRAELLGDGAARRTGTRSTPWRARWAETAGAEPLARLQDLDLGIYLPDDLLTKTDRASMAHSLEARVPFLDADVAELALALPTNAKVRGLQKKRLLRAAAAPLLPRAVVARTQARLLDPRRGLAARGRSSRSPANCFPAPSWSTAAPRCGCSTSTSLAATITRARCGDWSASSCGGRAREGAGRQPDVARAAAIPISARSWLRSPRARRARPRRRPRRARQPLRRAHSPPAAAGADAACAPARRRFRALPRADRADGAACEPCSRRRHGARSGRRQRRAQRRRCGSRRASSFAAPRRRSPTPSISPDGSRRSPASDAEVIDCGVDMEAFAPGVARPRDWPGDGRALLCVGSLIERKNVVALADAFAASRRAARSRSSATGRCGRELEGRAGVRARRPRAPRRRPGLGRRLRRALPAVAASSRSARRRSRRWRWSAPCSRPPSAARPSSSRPRPGVLVDPYDTDALAAASRRAAALPAPNPAARESPAEPRRAPPGGADGRRADARRRACGPDGADRGGSRR